MAPDSAAPWESRIHTTVVVGQWVALVIGVIASMVSTGGSLASFLAIGLASTYAIGATMVPERLYRARFGVEAVTLLGALLVLAALTLTGGADSPYLLLSMGPPILATIYGGFRAGLTTALLAAGLLAVVTLAEGTLILDAAGAMGLYLVFVVLVGVIRRLLEDMHRRATELAEEKESATKQVERLTQINKALLRLSEDVSSGKLNAIEVGAETLDGILERFPGSVGTLAVNGDNGPVVLAARGIPGEEGHVYEFPLATKDLDVGVLTLTTKAPLGPGELAEVAADIHPVSLAFANLQLLEDIVGSAVSEERVRLAREMHDEIGPALASLGLALDTAAMQQADRPEVAADLQVLRSTVTKLVEKVRAAVADLRTDPGPTLAARILNYTSGMNDGPPIIVDLKERRPPRPALIGDLTSIITEAVRNAYQHSRASRIVISGRVDRNFGVCSVVDDGVGFDPHVEPEGHYGLVGMRERAARISASVKIESKPGVGTAMTVEWGNT